MDISCLSARLAPGGAGSQLGKGKIEALACVLKHSISMLSSLLEPLISFPFSLISADDLASDFTETTEAIK